MLRGRSPDSMSGTGMSSILSLEFFFLALILRTRDTFSSRAFSFSLSVWCVSARVCTCVYVCVCMPSLQRSRIYSVHAAKGRMRAALNNNMPFHAAYILVNTSNLYYSTNDSTNLLCLLTAEPNEFLRMTCT